jgi:glycosyltransferase involved in cell wall biosynthesis
LPRARGVQVAHAVHALAGEVEAVDLAFEPAADKSDPFAHYGLIKPANVRLLPISRRLFWPFDGLRVQSHRLFARRLASLVEAAPRPDVVFVRHVKLAGDLVRRLPKLPLIYEAHEVFADTSSNHRTQESERQAIEGADLVLANSAATARRLEKRYRPGAPIQVLANGVTIPSNVVPRDWNNAKREIIYAGSLFGWKGVDDLVAAAAELSGYRITIVGGSTSEVDRLKSMAVAEGAELAFTGRIPHREALSRIGHACIAVLPNRPDPDSAFTSPLKLLEYLAHGCAVVATDLPSVREIVDDGEVVWAKAGDAQSIAQAIRTLANSPTTAEETARRGQDLAVGYAWETRARKLSQLLSDVIANARPLR